MPLLNPGQRKAERRGVERRHPAQACALDQLGVHARARWQDAAARREPAAVCGFAQHRDEVFSEQPRVQKLRHQNVARRLQRRSLRCQSAPQRAA